MTNIQLKEVAIYSLDGSKRRIITFETGKLNIIYGASQTGKSAIIPIIDYCLCSTTNRIPAGTIRENCSAFAISLFLGDQYLLIKRIGDADPQKILYAYSEQSLNVFNEDNWLQTTREKFKLHLNSQLESKTNIFLESFNGYNENQACNDAEISEMQLSSWLRLNKIG